MRVRFVNTVSALCYSIVRDESQRIPACDPSAVSPNAIVNFVVGQQGRMPDYLRLPLSLMTMIFALDGLRYGGAPFHRMTPDARRRQIDAWRTSRLGVARDFIRLYESLTLFCWYSMAVTTDVQAEAPVAVHAPVFDAPVLVAAGQLLLPLDRPAGVIADTYQPA